MPSLYVFSHGRVYDLSWKNFLIDPENKSKGTYKVMYDHGVRVYWTNDAHTYITHYDNLAKKVAS